MGNPTDALQHEVARFVKDGYQIRQQTPVSVQMVKPKHYRPIRDTALGFGLLSYAHRKEDSVYLYIDSKGKVQKQEGHT